MNSHAEPSAAPVAHYENFPVASWLCPSRLRAPIAAIYHFARTADDLADEGDAPAAQRLAQLALYRQCLHAAAQDGAPLQPHWPEVFAPLQQQIARHRLPVQLLGDLLDAFAQDVRKTAASEGYASRVELLDYCRRSANPVGRLLLHLWGIRDAASLTQSDAVCSALQLINFWQDLSVDVPRGRWYLADEDCTRHGVGRAAQRQAVASGAQTGPLTALVRDNVEWARSLMRQGAPLALRVPGRAGWELRLVVQGGLRILQKIERMQYQGFVRRPAIGKADVPWLLGKSLAMGWVSGR